MSELTNPPDKYKPNDPNWEGVNSVRIFSADTLPSTLPYDRLHITRWRIIRWHLRRKYPNDNVILRRDLYTKQELTLDLSKTLTLDEVDDE